MATSKSNDQDVLEFVVKNIVNHPEDVKTERKIDEMGVLITLKINPQDIGLVIGREGSIVRALRTILRVIGLRNHARVNLKIEEPQGASGGRPASRRGESSDVDKIVEDLKV